ncbi:unnamed protein product [Ixodes pacificus]
MELSCSSFALCSSSTAPIISFTTLIMALNWLSVRPFSMVSGIRNGITLQAITSLVRPSFLCMRAQIDAAANGASPKIPMSTAGSLERISGNTGRISSSTSHLSRCSSSFPRQTKQLTRT